MEKFVSDGEVYNNLFKLDDIILKYSYQSVDAWKALSNKNLSFLNIPIFCSLLSSDERIKFNNCSSKVYLPYLNGYSTLYGNSNFSFISDEKVLLLFKNILLLVKNMHDNCVFHGDMFSRNIMINDDLDVCFIDLDACIVDNIISFENTYSEDLISLDKKKNLTMIDDKMGVFNLLLYYFINGNFNVGVDYDIDYNKLVFSSELSDEVKSYGMGNVPSDDYYFLDIVHKCIHIYLYF